MKRGPAFIAAKGHGVREREQGLQPLEEKMQMVPNAVSFLV